MASEQTDGPEGPRRRSEELRDRRAERKRQIHHRRLIAGGVLALAVGAVLAVVAIAGSGDSDSGRAGLTEVIPGSHVFQGANGKSLGHSTSTGGSSKVLNATPQPNWEPHTGPVPILEYHVLGEAPADAPYPELYVERPDFRHQLEWLDGHGYQAVTLEQVEEAWYEGATLPPKPVVLSFDDGYRPQFTFALPQLRKHGWAGVLNLKAEGSDLYESNVKAMIAAGWELAAHTINHLDLTELGPEQLEEETAGARKLLQDEFHVPVKNFCYPAGQFDETVIAAVEKAGYVGATTEIPGYAESDAPYELARFEILGSTGVSGLEEDLASGP
ncbi:MAG TPA: polysaccharide deacetylase family protein [Solirubrobacterales bacterium]|nr:polysaccharide deacetylase family protein [Solirubrobacterales bacterium]